MESRRYDDDESAVTRGGASKRWAVAVVLGVGVLVNYFDG